MKKIISVLLIIFFSAYWGADFLRIKSSLAVSLNLPAPNQLLMASEEHHSPILKGIKLDPSNPFGIEFYIDSQNEFGVQEQDAQRLINYFFAGLTVDDKDLWVNLSPYESDRVMNNQLSLTDLGKDLLEQDYILKQLAASLSHPKTELGKEYWKNNAIELNKVWISPEKAEIYVDGNYVFVTDARLNVKSENQGSASDMLLPQITQDVNKGENFSKLRQVYNSLILAKWFKQNFFDSFYKSYINQNKITGIDSVDPELKKQVYQLYCEAFKQGAYNFTEKEKNNANKLIKRNYFSGGIALGVIPTSASSIKSLNQIPLVGNLFSVNGAVKYRTAKHLIKTAWLNAFVIFNSVAQELDLETFLASPFAEPKSTNEIQAQPSVDNWQHLQTFMLSKFNNSRQQRIIKEIIQRVTEAQIPLVLFTDYNQWIEHVKAKNTALSARAFVEGKTVNIYMDFARPNVLFHELIHVFQADNIAVYRELRSNTDLSPGEQEKQMYDLPMLKSFNKINQMVDATNDRVLIDLFYSMFDNLVYDYNNPIKNIWYNQRMGTYSLDSATALIQNFTNNMYNEKQSKLLLASDEHSLNQVTQNYAGAIDEFFAFIYGVAIAHDLGYGQEELSKDVQTREADVMSEVEFYRVINVEAIAAKFLYRLKKYPMILNEVVGYYSKELGFPRTRAFHASTIINDSYELGVVDNPAILSALADYYMFIGEDAKALQIYSKLISIVAKSEMDIALKMKETKAYSFALANIYANYKNYEKVNAIIKIIMPLLDIDELGFNNADKHANLIYDLIWIAALELKIEKHDSARKRVDVAYDVYMAGEKNFDKSVKISLLASLIEYYAVFDERAIVATLTKKMESNIRRLGKVAGPRDMADRLQNIAGLLAKIQDYSGAKKLHMRSLKYYADSSMVKSNVINMYLDSNRYLDVVKFIEKDLDSQNDPGWYFTLSDIYYHELSDDIKAVEVMERCYEAFPTDPETIKRLMDLYMLTGQKGKIDDLWSKADLVIEESVYTQLSRELNGGINLMEIELDNKNDAGIAFESGNVDLGIISLWYQIDGIEKQELAALGSI